jgi:hypothetical protein
VPGRLSISRKDQTVPGVHLIVESTRAMTSLSKRLAVLAIALLALGGGLGGCGETGAEEDAGANNTAQEEQSEQRPEEGGSETEGGTVVECFDGTYSDAGGSPGACSHRGGEKE